MNTTAQLASLYKSQVTDLNEKLKLSIAQGDYIQAKQIKQQLEVAKQNLKSDTTSELFQEHQEILKIIDEAYTEEEKNFNSTWEQRLDEFNINAAHKMDALKQELQSKLSELDQLFQEKPVRFSAQLISLRDQEIRLAKGGRFDEAAAVQKYADELEQKELIEHEQTQNVFKEQQKLDIYRFYEKQGKSLMTKIEAGRADILSKWANDMDKLDKHHEAMIKSEENRFIKVRNNKDILGTSKKQIIPEAIESPVKLYIESQGVAVNASQLGASMSPVTSRVQGLSKLRKE